MVSMHNDFGSNQVRPKFIQYEYSRKQLLFGKSVILLAGLSSFLEYRSSVISSLILGIDDLALSH